MLVIAHRTSRSYLDNGLVDLLRGGAAGSALDVQLLHAPRDEVLLFPEQVVVDLAHRLAQLSLQLQVLHVYLLSHRVRHYRNLCFVPFLLFFFFIVFFFF